MGAPETPPTLDEILGKTVIIGITRLTHDGELIRQEQHVGRFMSMDKSVHIELRDGQDLALPPVLAAFTRAAPGTYRLRSTGEIVENPDFATTWTVRAPAPKPPG